MTPEEQARGLPREDWQWLADQLRAWPEKRVHPERTMCDGALRRMAADVIEIALSQEESSAIVAFLRAGQQFNAMAAQDNQARDKRGHARVSEVLGRYADAIERGVHLQQQERQG